MDKCLNPKHINLGPSGTHLGGCNVKCCHPCVSSQPLVKVVQPVNLESFLILQFLVTVTRYNISHFLSLAYCNKIQNLLANKPQEWENKTFPGSDVKVIGSFVYNNIK